MVSGLLCIRAGNCLRIYIHKNKERDISDDNAQYEQRDLRRRMLFVYVIFPLERKIFDGQVIILGDGGLVFVNNVLRLLSSTKNGYYGRENTRTDR